MTVISRVLTAIASLALIAAVYLPIWKIDLTAPQYPEGLYMNIWASKLGGDVEIINGLNHYIGMKTLHANEFVEFTVLPWIIWGIALLGVLTAIIGKRKIVYAYFGLFLLFAVVAMVDFYRWEYSYGHNLNPEAPIQVPGMAYQPPLLGYKQLLNFSAYSIPDQGGWFFIGSGILLFGVIAIEWLKQRKEKKSTSNVASRVIPTAMAAMLVLLLGCTSGPEAIRFGKEGCDHCKMTIMDKKYGGEIVTSKGKIYRFDDIRCLSDFYKSGSVDKATCTVYFLDYDGNGNLLKSDAALLLRSDEMHSPMGGNIAAFHDDAALNAAQGKLHGTTVKWEELVR